MASDRPRSGRQWTRWAAAALLGFVIAYVAVVLVAQGTARATALDLMNVVTPLAVAALCAYAAVKAGNERDRWFWLLIGFAHVCSVVGEGFWAYNEVVRGVSVPFPSVADLGWVAFYPVSLGAILVLITFKGLPRLESVTRIVDGLLFSIAAGALCWVTLVAPYFRSGEGVLADIMVIGYNVGDVLLLLGLAAVWIGPERSSQPKGLGWLCGSLLLTMVADAGFALLTANGTYQTGSWPDPIWPLAYMLAGWGALAYIRESTCAQSQSEEGLPAVVQAMSERAKVMADRVRIALPYLVLPAIEAMLLVRFVVYRGDGGLAGDAATIGIAVLLTALILLRQFLVVVAKNRLEVSLTTLSGELETRVVERTEELAVEKENLALLNRVAAEMSQCVTAREVVRQGLHLSRRTALCTATGMLLNRPGWRAQFFGNAGLDRAGRLQFKAVVDCAAASIARSAVSPVVVDGDQLSACLDRGGFDKTFERVVMLPLVARRSVFGLLCLGYEAVEGEVSTESTALVQGVASQIAVTLENAWRHDELEHLADHDPVTGLFNHRGISRRMEQELARCQRAGTDFSLVTMDLDGFKLFNDTYGHAVGDEVLRHVARILKRMMRRSDIVGRQGGDEFSAILPDASCDQALEAVDRIRDALSDSAICLDGKTPIPLFMSYGVATYPEDGRRVSELLAEADANLYRSKQRGGNCVSAAILEDDDDRVSGGVISVLDGLINAVDNKDHYTRRHSEDVTAMAIALGTEVGLSADAVRSLRIAALLHDVGKIGIPDFILRKPGALTVDEFEAIKQHVLFGELFIKEIPDLVDVLGAVGSHHERWDGEGYPRGLAGEQIPLVGRILAVSDAYSAMTSDRPYRKALSTDEAREEMLRVSGTQLDPRLVEVFLAMVATRRSACAEAKADRTITVAGGAA